MMDVKYSICVLCMDQFEVTKKCLESIVNMTILDEFTEIIIVDNGSKDSTIPWLIDFQRENTTPRLRILLLLNSENRGCTGGRNQAVQLAHGKYIIILDNDVEIIHSDWLIKLRQFYCSYDKAGIIGPKMVFAENPKIIQQIGFGVTKSGNIGYIGRGELKSNDAYSYPRDLQGYPAACWFMESKLFTECGGFDETFFPVNYEDADFCYRIRERGYRIIYCPYVEMYHHEHITTWHSPSLSINRITLRNGKIFKERWKHMYSVEQGINQSDIFWGEVEVCGDD